MSIARMSIQKIFTWLDNIDSPGRKRKRTPLAEMSSNAAPYTPTGSPQKRRRRNEDEETSMLINDDTPRGPASLADISMPPQSTAGSSASGNSRRSESPTKSWDALKNATYPLSKRVFNTPSDLPTEELREMFTAMRRIAAGAGILHADRYKEYDKALDDDVLRERMQQSPRESFDASPDLGWVRGILKSAATNTQRSVFEAQWNCSVHWPLLSETRRLSRHCDTVEWHNVSAAQLDSRFIPRTASTTLKGRKADFALCLELDEGTERSLRKRLVTGLSQFDYPALSFRPTAVMIETKTDAGNLLEGALQLATCALAQVQCLKHLLQRAGNGQVVPPIVPLVVFSNQQAYLHCVQPLADHAVHWQAQQIGTLSTIEGILQVFTALQYLQHWADTRFRSWFRNNIIDSILSPR